MTMTYKVATVFGGTGFVGTQIVRALAKKGITVKVATRVPERAYFLRPCGTVGQIVPVACDYSEDSIAAAVKGADYVVNCIGILFEKKKGAFERAHVDIPGFIAAAATQNGVERLIHISALGVDQGKSNYARTKLRGEKAVLDHFPDATILRPSVIFGKGDQFFNMFARMAEFLPALPLIGGGKTKFQPVYVGDVADAVMAVLALPAFGRDNPQGKIYELGGPEVMSFREIYQTLFKYTGRKRALVSLPFGIAKIQASFLSVLPHPPLTRDQVESLKTDNVVSAVAFRLEDLGIEPRAMSLILPTYLKAYKPGGRFAGGDSVDRKQA